ncbi:hypothetical protein ABPG74_016208 [Tetrahymena malaccensis]
MKTLINKDTILKGQKSDYKIAENTNIQGGQAQIYFATDSQNQKEVVIKLYFKDSGFKVDCQVLQKISDKYSGDQEKIENLVRFYDQQSLFEKKKFLVLEFCNEGDLYNYLIKKQQKVQTLEQAIKVIEIAIQITKGNINQIYQQLITYDDKSVQIPFQETFPNVSQLVKKCILKDPKQRPDFQQVQTELKDILQNLQQRLDFSIIDSKCLLSQVEKYKDESWVFIKEEQQDKKSNFQLKQQKINQELQDQPQNDSSFTQQPQNYIYKQEEEKEQKQQMDLQQTNIDQKNSIINQIEKNQTQKQTIKELDKTVYSFNKIQLRIIKIFIENQKLLKKYGYTNGIQDVDQLKFKGIVIEDNIIEILSPLILQFILQFTDITYLQQIKKQLEQFTGKEYLQIQIDDFIDLLKNNTDMKNNLFKIIINNLFHDFNCAQRIFEIVQIFLNNLIQQQSQRDLRDINQLILQSEIINIQPNLQILFIEKYNEVTINNDINQIIITNSFISEKKYAILVPHKTYDNFFIV